MDNNLSEKLLHVAKEHWLALSLAVVGLTFFIYGLISLLGTNAQSEKISFETNSSSTVSSENSTVGQNIIAVDIEGEVVKPGVYKLKPNSLVQDALISSGGFSSFADRAWVAKNLNLALKVTDGQKIYIPREGELITTSDQSTLGSSTSISSSSDLININTASEKDLDSLPGIGPVTAGKIINNRPYVTINELLDKKTLSQKVFDQIKDNIIAQ